MTTNRLLSLRGVSSYRINGGPVTALRPSVRFVGLQAKDLPALQRIELQQDAAARVRFDATVEEPGDYQTSTLDWFGVTDGFDLADDVYVTANNAGVRIAGFIMASSGSSYAKHLVNSGSHAFDVVNFRAPGFEEADSSFDDPGMIMGRPRTLLSGEALRLQWDPTGQRWLVNAGAFSGDILTSDNVPLTVDGALLTRTV